MILKTLLGPAVGRDMSFNSPSCLQFSPLFDPELLEVLRLSNPRLRSIIAL